ncbi:MULTISPECIES: DUF3604 domain-containing protein [unclassified Lacrimispora]|uniref:DUF3604 domain-containing protein n=1 Tax=unclassified Lacrimispora TaxID=2719232 RepID=UPI00377058D1
MNIYWGDIHNHCGITYGYGSLQNALAAAANHLDFCAITGHAMWPDMHERTEDTAFVVDFHNRGFQKLRDHWPEVNGAMAAANSDRLVTFQAYEMHSSHYGDHHLVSPDDALPLIYRDSPRELKEDCGCRSLTVAHHIGYTPGYRGINWDEYDETVTPLVEVCSKHGCAMSETAAYPYYHNMGPRDSRNTVYEGLKRGHRFGFVGSTDHHAGYPGSYGDGKLAVLAEKKDRESIWDALVNRRTYAVTGDRIRCAFDVNGAVMGSIVNHTSSAREIHYAVEACYPIDKIVIYRNLEPIRIVEGLLLKPQAADRRYKVRVETGWGNNADSLYRFDCSADIENGRLLGIEPCFRGRSVLAPSAEDNASQDDINQIDNQILHRGETDAAWRCETVKNLSTLHPQTCAVVLEIEGTPDTKVRLSINGQETSHTVRELMAAGYSSHMKPYHSQAYKIHTAISTSQYMIEDTFTDMASGPRDFYHMEVSQQNGHWAYVTPVYFQ